MLEVGLTSRSQMVVTEEDTAVRLGSGDMDVLATPRLVALMENAAMNCVAGFLPEDSTTVGGFISVQHVAPSAVGAEVVAEALLKNIEGKKLYFLVKALEGDKTIGECEHIRFIVNRDKFMANLKK